MKKISSVIILAAFFLSACSSSGGEDNTNGTPTDTSIDFNFFPPTFFTDYDATADLSGVFSNPPSSDQDATGNLTEMLQDPTAFLGETAIPIQTTLTFTATSGIGGTALNTEYYSIDENNRRFLGVSGDVTITSSTPVTLPATARIGDSGNVGVYIDLDGMESTITWRLEDGFNGNAQLILFNSTNKVSGSLDNTFTTTYLIQPDGTRLSVELVTFNDTVKITNTLSGDYDI